MSQPPRYRQLAAELRAQIESGKLSPGDQLPTEHELCDAHAISRHTAREALRLLSEDGLIERRRGIGTVVTDARAAAFAQSLGDFDSVLQYARDAQLDVVSADVAGDDTLEGLGLTGAYTAFSGVRRRADGGALSLTRIFVRTDLAPDLSTARGLEGSFSEWVEATHGMAIANLTQRMEAVALSPDQAGSLGAAAGSPALRTVRRYRDSEDEILLLSESLHPAGRFAYEMRLKRTR